jgi:hypothetical protein
MITELYRRESICVKFFFLTDPQALSDVQFGRRDTGIVEKVRGTNFPKPTIE